MKIEYRPTLDDVFRLKLALHRRAAGHPLRWTILAGGVSIAAGGAMMASIASPVWWALTFAGALFASAAWAAGRINHPTPARVEQEFAARAWLREPFRIQVDDEGIHYEHGPFRSRAAWTVFTGLLETDHHLILLERPAPGALAYGLSKRELDRTPGGAAAWRTRFAARLSAARGNASA
jgi:hypothetical protein